MPMETEQLTERSVLTKLREPTDVLKRDNKNTVDNQIFGDCFYIVAGSFIVIALLYLTFHRYNV